jgi:hypothetical protein
MLKKTRADAGIADHSPHRDCSHDRHAQARVPPPDDAAAERSQSRWSAPSCD